MAKKGGSKRRSNKKILDAFQIAQRAEEGGVSDDETGKGKFAVRDGVMDALHLLGKSSSANDDDSEEDEEIDSDEALGSDDDFDVLNTKFSQTIRDKSKKSKQRAKDRRRGKADLLSLEEEEDDDGYASIDESQLVGLSEAWDMDDKDLKLSQRDSKGTDIVLDDAWESESEQENDSEEDSESDDEEDSEVDDVDDVSSEELDVFEGFDDEDNDEVDLANTLKSVQAKLPKAQREKKKLLTEKREEDEYSLPTSGNKLTLEDMMADVDSNEKLLIDKDKKTTLATPLPKRIQQRNDRKVAYDLTKQEVDKWKDTVKQNREAEVLHFPMNPTVQHNDSAVTFKSENKPSTELEKKVHDLLSESALLDDKKEATFEEIESGKLSVEDMKKRTNELRLMRELMFREEKRAKRIKKIKSKQYHKIQKKERLRNQEMVEGSDAESDAETHDMKRAQERMSLKHKTQLNWAKSMIKSGLSKDANNRAELEEMLRQGERLRAKQLGHEEGEQSDSGVSDIENEYERESGDDDDEADNVKAKLGKGVLAMDFMKAADERAKAENKREIELLRQQESESYSFDAEEALSVNVNKNQGRRVYTPQAANMMAEVDKVNEDVMRELEDDHEKDLVTRLQGKSASKSKANELRSTSATAANNTAPTSNSDAALTEVVEEENPWLVSGDKVQRAKKITVVDQHSNKLSKAAQKIKKKTKSSSGSRDESSIDMNITLKPVNGDVHDNDEAEDEGEDVGTMFTQKDLIKEAFAGDDVVTEFEIEKKRTIREDDDKEEDLTIPGWGDWAGGNKKSKKRKVVRKVQGVVQLDKRKDKNLKNVIINEKVNKKSLKYQSSAVPFPYENREQYERALRMPVGQEWASRETHQRLTMPRVITKQGTVIDPLKAPFK